MTIDKKNGTYKYAHCSEQRKEREGSHWVCKRTDMLFNGGKGGVEIPFNVTVKNTY